MNSVIDTLRFSEKLQTSGFAAEQANALARALADELGEQLVTKDDVRGLQRSIDGLENGSETQNQGIAVLKQDVAVLKQDVAVLKQDVAKIKGDIKAIYARLDSLELRLNFTLGLIGLLVALQLIPVVRAFTG